MDAVIRRLVFQVERRSNVLAILLTGSTATRREYRAYDDFDVVVFTRTPCAGKTYYEIINPTKKPYLISIYFAQLGRVQPKIPNVLNQGDVKALFGRKETLQCVFVERPRGIKPQPSRLAHFAKEQERYWEIFVDCVFIIARYERRGIRHRAKARLARQAIRAISKHFHAHYGKAFPYSNRTDWRFIVLKTTQLLGEKRFVLRCRNQRLFRDFRRLARLSLAEKVIDEGSASG